MQIIQLGGGGGGGGGDEIPLLSLFLYLFNEAEQGFAAHLLDLRSDPSQRQCQE